MHQCALIVPVIGSLMPASLGTADWRKLPTRPPPLPSLSLLSLKHQCPILSLAGGASPPQSPRSCPGPFYTWDNNSASEQ